MCTDLGCNVLSDLCAYPFTPITPRAAPVSSPPSPRGGGPVPRGPPPPVARVPLPPPPLALKCPPPPPRLAGLTPLHCPRSVSASSPAALVTSAMRCQSCAPSPHCRPRPLSGLTPLHLPRSVSASSPAALLSPAMRHQSCPPPCCPRSPGRVDPTALASECQRKFACSTTVEDLPGKNSYGQAVILQVGGGIPPESCCYSGMYSAVATERRVHVACDSARADCVCCCCGLVRRGAGLRSCLTTS